MDQIKPNMPYRELEEYSGVPPSVTTSILNNPNYRPTDKTLRKLASYFRTDFRELWQLVYATPPVEGRQGDVILVPFLPNTTLSAGPGGVHEDGVPYLLKPPDQRTHAFRAVSVVGDCMEPDITAGSIAIVNTSLDGRPDDIVAAEHDGEILVKWLRRRGGQLYLEANQPGYAPILVDESTRILGVVRWSGREH